MSIINAMENSRTWKSDSLIIGFLLLHLESKKFLNSQVYRFTLVKFISSLNLKVIYGCSVIDEVVSSFNLTAFSLAFLSLKTSILKIKVGEDECVYGRTLNWTHPQVSKTLQFSKFNECLLCSAEQISKVRWKPKILFHWVSSLCHYWYYRKKKNQKTLKILRSRNLWLMLWFCAV